MEEKAGKRFLQKAYISRSEAREGKEVKVGGPSRIKTRRQAFIDSMCKGPEAKTAKLH